MRGQVNLGEKPRPHPEERAKRVSKDEAVFDVVAGPELAALLRATALSRLGAT
jgi:hypothetical protein